MRTKAVSDSPLKERLSGILVHPTAFPSPYGIGDLGQGARDFIDFLEKARQHLWQVLPLGPTGFGNSPYQSYSSFAGQPLLISPEDLVNDGLLTWEDVRQLPHWENELRVDYDAVAEYKETLLRTAYSNFKKTKNEFLVKNYRSFLRTHNWIKDYSLFMACKQYHEGVNWQEWTAEIATPTDAAKEKWTRKLKDDVDFYRFQQFIFYRQWDALKQYANEKDISIIGDIPIFISSDSCDVWANPELFQLDSKGYPTKVAGVPPDYFSATGQLWGNPLYDWDAHKKTGYEWWIQRIKAQLAITDYLRIDHFRGFEAYWAVPADEETAINGKWVKGPGADLFRAIADALGEDLPIIAEDLGVITPEVEALRDEFEFPGMKVLQFAFDDIGENAFLPHHYPYNCVCYSGTHDNDTTYGWYQKASEASRDKVRRYMGCDGNNVSWDFLCTAWKSVARMAIVPLQDVMRMDSDARMNIPGTAEGNWAWRYSKAQLKEEFAVDLRLTTELFGRC
jgi:4-alpha-glucanotransferase